VEQKSYSGKAPSAPSTVRFGAFELDLRAAELCKNGHKIRLQQQPVQILVELLGRPREVVLREEIRTKLWPNNTVVEFDHSINAAIKRLRDSLQDSAETPRYIETLPRLGYRFIAPVSWPQLGDFAPAKTVPIAVSPPAPLPKTRHFWWFACAVAIALIATGVGLEWLLSTLKQAKGDAPLPAVPLTGNLGYEMFPAFSPEGTRVAYSWEAPGQGRPNIYVKLIGQGDPIRLTAESAGDFAPAWSPDGRWIAFLRARGTSQAAIILTPSLGGQERQLAEIGFGTRSILQHRRAYGVPPPFLAWSRDGRWLVSLEQNSPHETFSIVRISVETGEKGRLTFPSIRSSGDGGLAVSPDGKTLAFTRTLGIFERDIYIVPLSEDMLAQAEPTRLSFANKEIDGLAWTADGHRLVFSSKRGGRLELWQMRAVPSGQAVRLAAAGDEPGHVAIAREGHHLMYSHKAFSGHISRMSLGAHKGEQPHPLISSTRIDGHSHYSPDGQHIAFESNRSGHDEIWTCRADGSRPVQLTALHAWAGSPRWSPDGQKIAFDSNAAGDWDIHVISAQGGRPVRLTTSEANEYRPSWSHDGKWIYYCSTRTQHRQIWKIPGTGGTEVQVTRRGGFVAYESADGKDLYYTKERELWKMPVGGGDEGRISASLFQNSFAPAKSGVYFLEGPASSEATLRLQFFDSATQAIKTIAVIPASMGGGISVSPDGGYMLLDGLDREDSELMLIENFR
jgi:Tol biopolymer transport system component/DNA-binding winged helix-turn-helix (wHTH) protein